MRPSHAPAVLSPQGVVGFTSAPPSLQHRLTGAGTTVRQLAEGARKQVSAMKTGIGFAYRTGQAARLNVGSDSRTGRSNRRVAVSDSAFRSCRAGTFHRCAWGCSCDRPASDFPVPPPRAKARASGLPKSLGLIDKGNGTATRSVSPGPKDEAGTYIVPHNR